MSFPRLVLDILKDDNNVVLVSGRGGGSYSDSSSLLSQSLILVGWVGKSKARVEFLGSFLSSSLFSWVFSWVFSWWWVVDVIVYS